MMLEPLTMEMLYKYLEDPNKLKEGLESHLRIKTILGIDIYRYSKYPMPTQILIPYIFDTLYSNAVSNLTSVEPFFFASYAKSELDFRTKFISTGDGGFQIFDDPMQAVLFALFFQTSVKRFLTGTHLDAAGERLLGHVGDLELRYAITTDAIYTDNKNYYGPGIITNARILSKDSLNRLLIDSTTLKWFVNEINSVENLMDVNKAKLKHTQYFRDYDISKMSWCLGKENCFKSVDVLKIGSLEAKGTPLDIYNLHIQARLELKTNPKKPYSTFITTLGNLNTSGIA